MSQRIVFELLKESEGSTTRSELLEKIEEKYPERSLSDYLSLRLSSLIEKGAVLEKTRDGTTKYKTNPEYSSENISTSLLDIDKNVSRSDLEANDLEVTNIVGNSRFFESVDLQQLGSDFSNIEYIPETSPMAVWRPFEENTVTVLVPSSGRITIVGSKTQEELLETIDETYTQLGPYAEETIPYEEILNNFQISNIAATGCLNRDLQLSAVALGLGLDNAEYDPERFPGIVYRPTEGVVVLVFRSGNVVINSNSYSSILDGWNTLRKDLREIGVKINF